MKVLESFVLIQCIPTSCTVEDGKREVGSEGERWTLGSGKHKAGSGKERAASGKRKGTDGFRYHEVKHRVCQQCKRKVGNWKFKVTGEEWTGGIVSSINGTCLPVAFLAKTIPCPVTMFHPRRAK